MPRPGVNVTVLDSAPTKPAPTDTGTAFIVGFTNTGSPTVGPVLVTSLARFVTALGPRTGAEAVYDAVECYFAEGGSRAYIQTTPTAPSAANYLTALNRMGIDLGPGQVLAPGSTDATVAGHLLDHAATNNRRALIDLVDNGTVATVTAAAAALAAHTNARYGAAWGGNWPVIAGVTAGTTRTVAPSGLMAGLIAGSDRQKSPNIAAAGSQQVPRTTVALTREFTRADGETLNEAGVNIFRTVFGQIQNYGFRSLASDTNFPQWYQFTNSRLVMAIVAKAIAVSTRYTFAQIDGQRKKLAQYEGDLVGEAFMPYFTAGSLYGSTPSQAFSVDATSVEANPDSALAEGTVRALCAIRPSPFAEVIEVQIINTPITTTLA